VTVFKLVWKREPEMNADVANVAHLVRASGCGSEGSGFDPHHSPHEMI
jgi:hypothetical protein